MDSKECAIEIGNRDLAWCGYENPSIADRRPWCGDKALRCVLWELQRREAQWQPEAMAAGSSTSLLLMFAAANSP